MTFTQLNRLPSMPWHCLRIPRYGIVGYAGWLGFVRACVRSAKLGASVVYYGSSPPPASLSSIRAPVLGLYGGNDARVNATIAPADSSMKAHNKTYTYNIYEGAGHGFLRAQAGQEGANLKATQQAWPATIELSVAIFVDSSIE